MQRRMSVLLVVLREANLDMLGSGGVKHTLPAHLDTSLEEIIDRGRVIDRRPGYIRLRGGPAMIKGMPFGKAFLTAVGGIHAQDEIEMEITRVPRKS
ncbi:hypothetical protein F4804DRAFT_123014 [Jackrogersella minutella]|nr:hypothetical protein F4804DRAFT_123014 [Jackrogersella minutella]